MRERRRPWEYPGDIEWIDTLCRRGIGGSIDNRHITPSGRIMHMGQNSWLYMGYNDAIGCQLHYNRVTHNAQIIKSPLNRAIWKLNNKLDLEAWLGSDDEMIKHEYMCGFEARMIMD